MKRLLKGKANKETESEGVGAREKSYERAYVVIIRVNKCWKMIMIIYIST